MKQFVDGVQKDLRMATDLASRGGLHFEDPLMAVYHFRKHGSEFPGFIQQFGNGIEVYLGEVKNHVFGDANLRECWTGVRII